jgi:metal-dependent amidase/aminoacylase/carboxypeptidase family protein
MAEFAIASDCRLISRRATADWDVISLRMSTCLDLVRRICGEADKDFAEKIRSTLTEKDIATVDHAIGMDPTDRPLADFLVPVNAKRNPQVASTDVGDVCWVVPTVQVRAPTLATGTPGHTWQVVAQGKSPSAHKAMVRAAKAMAGLGINCQTVLRRRWTCP